MDLGALVIEVEGGLEVPRQLGFESCGNHRLVHVKDDGLLLRRLAELDRLHHQLLLVLVRLLVLLLELGAELQQVDELDVDQLRRVLLHEAGRLRIVVLGLILLVYVEFRVKLTVLLAAVAEVRFDAVLLPLRAADLTLQIPLQLLELRLEHFADIPGTFGCLHRYNQVNT